MTMNTRTSRRLDLGSSNKEASRPHIDSHQEITVEEQPNKEMLREIFKSEIDALVRDDLRKAEEKLKQEFQAKYDMRVTQMEKDLAAYKDSAEETKTNFECLLGSLKKSYEEKISSDIRQLDLVLVEIVLQCLTKMIGQSELYTKLIEANIEESLERKSATSQALIKVSENEYRFLRRQFPTAEWIQQVKVEERLNDGQMLLDDGISSVYEIGFISQLDLLRSAFVARLREHHAI